MTVNKLRAGLVVRSRRGSILILNLAIAIGVIMALSFFALNFVRFLGSHQEQKTAIEAAALAVAKDMSRIVIEDPQFGYVALSDYAPNGKGTTAGDNYDLPVTGINTLLGTIRLDLIIADYMQDPIMTRLATEDYNSAMNTVAKLNFALAQAVQPGGTGTDQDGNTVNPTQDAISSYENNLIRMTGRKNVLVPGSLKLSLGYVDALESNLSLPQPRNTAQVSTGQTLNGYYAANMNIPYNNLSFVFASLGKDTNLVDQKTFQSSVSGVAYSIPTVVKCEADQQFFEQNQNGTPATRTVHMISAAEAAWMKDQRPCPGALTVSFPNGPIAEITSPGDLIKNSQISQSPCDYLDTVYVGDHPSAPLVSMPLTVLNGLADKSHPPFEDAFSVALYDWLRRGGPTVNVKSVVEMFQTPFSNANFAVINEYQVTKNGTIAYNAVPSSAVTLPVSQKQFQTYSGLAYYSPSTGQRYDLYLTNYVFQPGRTNGGKHAGEPLDGTPVGGGPANAPSFIPDSNFLIGPGSGTVRPTYQSTGCAVDVSFKLYVPPVIPLGKP